MSTASCVSKAGCQLQAPVALKHTLFQCSLWRGCGRAAQSAPRTHATMPDEPQRTEGGEGEFKDCGFALVALRSRNSNSSSSSQWRDLSWWLGGDCSRWRGEWNKLKHFFFIVFPVFLFWGQPCFTKIQIFQHWDHDWRAKETNYLILFLFFAAVTVVEKELIPGRRKVGRLRKASPDTILGW